jgi:hypothetical protein
MNKELKITIPGIGLRQLLLMAFALSGMAVLIYEVVWIRPLQLVFGSTVYAVSTMLTTFMVDEKDMEGYVNGDSLITDDQPILEFSTPINLAIGNMKERVLFDIENFIKGE